MSQLRAAREVLHLAHARVRVAMGAPPRVVREVFAPVLAEVCDGSAFPPVWDAVQAPPQLDAAVIAWLACDAWGSAPDESLLRGLVALQVRCPYHSVCGLCSSMYASVCVCVPVWACVGLCVCRHEPYRLARTAA